MNANIKIWLPPMLTLLGTLIVVTFTAWLSMRSMHDMIGELRQEVRADIATLRGELKVDVASLRGELLRIENKLDHYRKLSS